VATHGRGFWVLDQMTPLRELAAHGGEIASAKAYLFAPGETFAMQQGSQNGTPLPHEEPQEQNPPSGVIAYYWLQSAAQGPVKLELVDEGGKVEACQASDTPVKPVDTEAINVQAYWMEPTPPPAAGAGMHRAALNVEAPRGFGRRAAPPPVDACHPAGSVPAQADAATARPARGPQGLQGLQPGNYTVRLWVDGQTLTQPVTVKPDPRRLPKGAAAPEEENDDDE
jgi:hypothetical protein